MKPNMKKFSGDRDHMPAFPDAKSYSLQQYAIKETYKERYVLLSDTERGKMIAKERDITKISKEDQAFIPQNSPLFYAFRTMVRFTGSTSAEYLGMHDFKTGTLFSLPTSMLVTKPTNPPFDRMITYLKHGKVPRAPLSQPGPLFAANGTEHEENVNATILGAIPSMKMFEVGTIVITDEHLQYSGVYDAFDPEKKKKVDLACEIAVSPDYDCIAPEFISVGVDGKVVYGEPTPMAGEQKVPTVFIPFDPPDTQYFGADFRFVPNRKAKTTPPEYYMPQVFLEMLALKRKSNLLSFFIAKRGMTTFKIDMDAEYMSMIVTFLQYLYTEFAQKHKPVPVDYFHSLKDTDARKIVYMRFIGKTIEIVNSAKIYLEVSPQKIHEIHEKVIACTRESDKHTVSYVKYPIIPDFLPKYHAVLLHGRRLYEDYMQIEWPHNWTSLDSRQKNIRLLTDVQLLPNAMQICEDIIETKKRSYPEATREDVEVLNVAIEGAENYLFSVYDIIHRLYGSPDMKGSLSLGLFHANIVKTAHGEMKRLCQMPPSEEYNVAPGRHRVDEVFTCVWTNRAVARFNKVVENRIEPSDGVFGASSILKHSCAVSEYTLVNVPDPNRNRNCEMWEYARLISTLMMMRSVLSEQQQAV